MEYSNVVICFCKHPEPGIVKSRLAKDIGDKNAAKVYKILLKNTLNNICGHAFDVLLYCYPDINHSTIQNFASKYSLSLHNQHGKDLGDKMWRAIKTNLVNYQSVVLVGSDCLHINANYINNAFELLSNNYDIVLGPTEDGGYALIGANKVDESIFQDIVWSTKDVFRETQIKLAQLKWKHEDLKIVRDLDNLDDYQYFSTHKEFMHLFNSTLTS